VADHPYRHADNIAFWSSAVAVQFDPGRVPEPPCFKLDRSDRFMSAGSCFAANVRRYLDAWGLQYVETEGPHPQWPESAESPYYETYSARYGNVYTARQMVQLLQRAIGEFAPLEDHWVDPAGRFVDPYRPGLKHRAFSLPELRALTAQHLRAVRRAVETASVFVFTLGLTEAWVSIEDGAVFPACPGTVAGEYDPDRHRFVNFSCSEATADLDLMVVLLRRINPEIRVIVTVSPVPLVATASGRHVLTATAYSKAVLRVAADEVVRRHGDVAYFPAYEMVLGPQHRVSPFADDLRTVREPVVAEVMGAFRSVYIADAVGAPQWVAGLEQVQLADAVSAALEDDCEEMFQDERIWRGEAARPAHVRKPLDLETLVLGSGSHGEGTGRFCVMEAASHAAGEIWSDRPSSASPVVSDFLRTLNDAMGDDDRQILKVLIRTLPGSRGDDALETARSWTVMDWHCRRWTATWLRAAGHLEEADALTWVGEITDIDTLRAAVPALEHACSAAATMRVATTHEALEQGLDLALAATDADPTQPGVVAARDAIQSDGGGFAMRAAQKQVPVAGRWSPKRRALWRDACDAATYGMAISAGTAQIAAVRALGATSAWSAGWSTSRSAAPDTWDRAAKAARSIGRDAALVIAWRPAWRASAGPVGRTSWHVARDGAEAALRAPVTELQNAAVELAAALIDRSGHPKVVQELHVAR
jgi:hypothetical protein